MLFRGQSAAQCVARFVERESLQGKRQWIENLFAPLAALAAQKLRQLDYIGWPELEIDDASLDFLRNESHRRGDDDELPLVQTALIDVSQAASGLGGFPQRVMKILEVEDGGVLVRGDEVQSSASSLSAGLGRFAIPMHPLGEAPGPNGRRRSE